jgi:Ser/Thr protein kinase RdoA (MazF antagonist)
VAGGRTDCPPIQELRCQAIGEGVGLMAEILRCELTFAGDDGPFESVIVKLPSDSPRNRRLGRRWRLYRREFNFYRDVAAASPLPAPALLYGDFDNRSHRFVLVLEDLGGMTAADQVQGATRDQARRAVREVAKLHGKYWDRVEPLAKSGFHEPLAPWVWWVLQLAYLASLPRTLPRLGGSWPEEIRDLAEEYGLRLVDHLDHLAGEPLTFVHGDYRLDNMFFGGDGETGFAAVDWQNSAVSIGPCDVAYFLAGSLSVADRRAIEKETLLEYHDIVCSLGARDFPFEHCWRLYRETLLGCLVLPVIITGWLEENQGRQLELRDAIATRTAAALRDREADAFLPPLPPPASPKGLRQALFRGGYRVWRALA